MGILKVSATSNAIRAAGALANTIRQQGEAEIQAIGPKAVNQTVKAIAIARSYLASSGIDLVAIPSFVDVEIDGEPRTAIRFLVKPRHKLIEEAKQRAAEVAAAPASPAPTAERPESPPPDVLAGTSTGAGTTTAEGGTETPDAEEQGGYFSASSEPPGASEGDVQREGTWL